MATIYETLENSTQFTIKHRDESADFVLPEWLTEVGLTDRDKILEYLTNLDTGQFLGVWHNNIAQTYIDLRAAARPIVKVFTSDAKRAESFALIKDPENYDLFETRSSKGEVKYCYTKRLLADLEAAQERIDSYTWKPVPVPDQSKVDKKKAAAKQAEAVKQAGLSMARAMYTAKLPEETIMAALLPVYGPDLAREIWQEISEN